MGGHDDHGHGHGGAGHGHGHDQGHGHDRGHAPAAAAGGDAHAHDEDPAHHGEPPFVKDEPFGPPKKMVPVGDGVELACLDRGEGPAILFLHGFPTSAYLFRHAIEELEASHRCVAPDLLGLGDSTGPADADLSFPAQAERVARLLDTLGIPEATVVGHDQGGGVAQHLLVVAPERVARLALVDSIAFDNWPIAVTRRLGRLARSRILFDLATETGLLRRFAGSASGLRAGVHDPAALTDAAIDEYLRPAVEGNLFFRDARERMRRYAAQFCCVERPSTLDCVDALKAFTRPALVVWGAEDRWLSVSWAKKLADTIPGCRRLELLAFCGHLVPEEQPKALAGFIAELIAAPAESPATEAATVEG